MAVWLPAQNKFYLPPQPSTKVLSTDEYVSRTNIFYHASSERLLTVGHPFYEIYKEERSEEVIVPKVSPNQYRVFRLLLPDPNNFAFGDKSLFDPEKERLVWGLRGLEIGRGQPLGISVTGHPTFDRYNDVENPNKNLAGHGGGTDSRVNMGLDPKQTQMFMIGCKPALGEHWSLTRWCTGQVHTAGQCPPIELRNTTIEDGDMVDIGFGAMDFKALQHYKSGVPIDIVNSACKYPDYLKMANEPYGDRCFFFVRREQLYARHIMSRSGTQGLEPVPKDTYATREDNNIGTTNYFSTPSGSLVSSEGQLFNRPYWIQRSQGKNNGIAWGNQLFLTVVDNTRGTPLTINIGQQDKPEEGNYVPSSYRTYLRHVEEYEVSIIVQLCKVKLSPENLAIIHTMDPNIIEDWHLNVTPPSGTLDDTYRYINSLATKCPTNIPPKTNVDPFADFKFWEVDLKDKMTEQLDQTPLGRKFLFQTNVLRPRSVKVRSTSHVSVKRKAVKRKRK
ncbi:major capsid L1 protein [Lambdapapillomavirus 2]|uniref:Major capsid protein L1 n=11 Tax=Papillomaviridae TaxID=151340 RepID=VL1_COPV6|nr:major capsid L1 protein [Lambdapapillomavirus 2]Q89828.1 RecName: Full=Major capsid protein L1 [Canine oral papillomavirus (strain Y62)]ABF58087.1 codon-optimized L1 protein [synthetic construct]QBA88848.1 late protein 1 [Canine papillomavirus]AAA61750.1 major capsid protein [Lambdapapillomavirus 2]ACK57369.1 major capsid protein [Lambdapapillomavirus 2]ADH77391.1 L1 [Lambdapapillomavirus 2]